MSAVVVFVVLSLVAAVLWSGRHGGYPPQPFRGRACQGSRWRRAFPSAPKQQLRSFLGTFAEAFAFRPASALQFAPHDCVLSIYRAIYSRNNLVDSLELETLARLLERRYGVALGDVWSTDLTLGQLFTHTYRNHLSPT